MFINVGQQLFAHTCATGGPSQLFRPSGLKGFKRFLNAAAWDLITALSRRILSTYILHS